MKFKERALAIVLSAIMVFTFMPALAFAADDAAVPAMKIHQAKVEKPEKPKASAAKMTSISFTSKEDVTGRAGASYADIEVKGASITINYSDGKSETYKYLESVYDDNIDDWLYDSGWYLNGDFNNDPAELGIYVDTRGRLKEGNNECDLCIWDDVADDYIVCSINVVAVKNEDVLSVSYEHVSGKALTGKAQTGDKMYTYFWDSSDAEDIEDYFFDEYRELAGDKLTIEWRTEEEVWDEAINDYKMVFGSEKKVYTCQEFTDEDGDRSYAFIGDSWTDEDGEVHYDREWPDFYDDQVRGEWTWAGLDKGEVTVSYEGVDADTKLYVDIPDDKFLKSAELRLADGFEPKVSIGQNNWIETEAFFGKGNEFVVTYTDNSTDTYTFNADKYAFVNAKGEEAWFSADLEDQGIKLKKDVPTEVTFQHWKELDEDYYDNIEFKYTVTAKKIGVYAEYAGRYEYTGKPIKPKVVVKAMYGNTKVPATAYKYTAPKNKAIGEYAFDITLVDTDTYIAMETDTPTTMWTWYQIIPKKIKLSSVVKGKKSFTAKWKKLSKKDKSLITGFMIEYSTKKSFSDSKMVKVKKSAVSKTIKKLKGNKYYYVRIYTYKTKTYTYYDENGKKHTEKYNLLSKPSAYKKVKTRK